MNEQYKSDSMDHLKEEEEEEGKESKERERKREEGRGGREREDKESLCLLGSRMFVIFKLNYISVPSSS